MAVGLAATLAACSASPGNCPRLPEGHYCLQPTTDVPALTLTQSVTVARNGAEDRWLASIEADASSLRYAVLTPFGQTLLSGSYDNRNARLTGPAADRGLDPALPIAFVQLALWPATTVRAGLSEGMTMEETPELRRLSHAGKTIFEIAYSGVRPYYRSITLRLPEWDTEIRAETLPGAAPTERAQ